MDMYAVNKIPIARQDAIAGKPGSYKKPLQKRLQPWLFLLTLFLSKNS